MMIGSVRVLSIAIALCTLCVRSSLTHDTPCSGGCTPVPRAKWGSAEAKRLVKAQQPVILLDTGFVTDAVLTKWTGEYLKETWDIEAARECKALFSKKKSTRGLSIFQYTERLPAAEYNAGGFEWDEEAITQNATSMSEFLSTLEERHKIGLHGYLQDTGLANPTGLDRCYGKQISEDIAKLGWKFAKDLLKLGWWPNTPKSQRKKSPANWKEYSDVIWLGDSKVVTPLHKDDQHGMLAQMRGVKQIHLWPPSEFPHMHSLPYCHPASGGSLIEDIHDIPTEYATEFFKAKNGMVAEISPGEVLYTPLQWWHDVQQQDNDPLPLSISIAWTVDVVELFDTNTNKYDAVRKRLRVLKIIEDEITTRYGGRESIEYLRALDHGELDSRNNVATNPLSVKIHQELMPQIEEQLEIMKVLKKGETAADFMKWMVKGRYNLTTIENPPFHITEGYRAKMKRLRREKKERAQAEERKDQEIRKEL